MFAAHRGSRISLYGASAVVRTRAPDTPERLLAPKSVGTQKRAKPSKMAARVDDRNCSLALAGPFSDGGIERIDAIGFQAIEDGSSDVARAACHAQLCRSLDRRRQALGTAQIDRALIVSSLGSHRDPCGT